MVEPTGYTALDLIGFTDKGPYDPLANYVRNDLVHVGNSTWRCKIDDTTGITPTEGANWTIFIESATSLAGMSDVDLNTPKAGDGLVHNGNDWKNIPIMTKEQWQKNGAYNLCPVTAITQSLGGLTITVNSDGSVTVGSGTASSLIDLALNVKTDMPLADGDYRLVGCPNHPNVSLRVLTNDYNTNKVYDYGTGGDFSFSNSVDKNAAVYLRINSGTVISSPITFKPMITTDLNATYDDYVPHAMTNRELTEKVSGYKILATASANQTFSAQMSTLYSAYNSLSTADKLLTEVWRDDNGALGVFHLDVRGDAIFSNNYVASDGSTSMIRFLRLSTPLAWNIKIATNGTVTTENVNSSTNTTKLILVKRSV